MSRDDPNHCHRLDFSVPRESCDDAVTLLWDLECQGVEEAQRGNVICLAAYFSSQFSGERLLARVADRFPDSRPRIETIRFDPGQWLDRYRQSFSGFAIDRTFYVHPPWDRPSAIHPVNIVIEPGHGFGTGTHESTRLALRAIGTLVREGGTLLDVGTGSGILSAGAGRLEPAGEITALDIDPLAVHAARDTLSRNGVRAHLLVGETRTLKATFDVVVGNLTGPIIRRLSAELGRLTGNRLVVSGFTEDEAELVRYDLEAATGLAVERRLSEGGWCCLTLGRSIGESTEVGTTTVSPGRRRPA